MSSNHSSRYSILVIACLFHAGDHLIDPFQVATCQAVGLDARPAHRAEHHGPPLQLVAECQGPRISHGLLKPPLRDVLPVGSQLIECDHNFGLVSGLLTKFFRQVRRTGMAAFASG